MTSTTPTLKRNVPIYARAFTREEFEGNARVINRTQRFAVVRDGVATITDNAAWSLRGLSPGCAAPIVFQFCLVRFVHAPGGPAVGRWVEVKQCSP